MKTSRTVVDEAYKAWTTAIERLDHEKNAMDDFRERRDEVIASSVSSGMSQEIAEKHYDDLMNGHQDATTSACKGSEQAGKEHSRLKARYKAGR